MNECVKKVSKILRVFRVSFSSFFCSETHLKRTFAPETPILETLKESRPKT